jgi:DNA end-binding protein Ku
MSRALWKGAISFGLVHVPVELYSAEKPNELNFDLLDKHDMQPVGYRHYNKHTGKSVSHEAIVKGYEYAKGKYVVLSDADFRAANIEATQTIEILSFDLVSLLKRSLGKAKPSGKREAARHEAGGRA